MLCMVEQGMPEGSSHIPPVPGKDQACGSDLVVWLALLENLQREKGTDKSIASHHHECKRQEESGQHAQRVEQGEVTG